MSKPIIIAVFSAFFILCVGVQFLSINDTDSTISTTKNYFNAH